MTPGTQDSSILDLSERSFLFDAPSLTDPNACQPAHTPVISVTTSQTKVQEVFREILKDPRVGILGVISRYIGRWTCG